MALPEWVQDELNARRQLEKAETELWRTGAVDPDQYPFCPYHGQYRCTEEHVTSDEYHYVAK